MSVPRNDTSPPGRWTANTANARGARTSACGPTIVVRLRQLACRGSIDTHHARSLHRLAGGVTSQAAAFAVGSGAALGDTVATDAGQHTLAAPFGAAPAHRFPPGSDERCSGSRRADPPPTLCSFPLRCDSGRSLRPVRAPSSATSSRPAPRACTRSRRTSGCCATSRRRASSSWTPCPSPRGARRGRTTSPSRTRPTGPACSTT